MPRLVAGPIVLAVIGGAVWASMGERPQPTPVNYTLPADARQKDSELDRQLCRKMRVCGKYDRARVECATAANIETCLRIKMGNDVEYVDLCGGDKQGRPAAPLDPRTPTALRCFFLKD